MVSQTQGYQMTFESNAGKVFRQEMKELLRPELEEELCPKIEKAAKEAAINAYRNLYVAGKLDRLDAESALKEYLSSDQIASTLRTWDRGIKALKAKEPEM